MATGSKPPAGPGRPKGLKNKITPDMRANYQEAFIQLGGAEALAKWATRKVRKAPNGYSKRAARRGKPLEFRITQPNLETFYRLAARLIPETTITTTEEDQ